MRKAGTLLVSCSCRQGHQDLGRPGLSLLNLDTQVSPCTHETPAVSLLWLGAGATLAVLQRRCCGRISGWGKTTGQKTGMGLGEHPGTICGKEGAEVTLEEGMKSR